MTPGIRKLALTVHLTCSIGWLGAVAAFLALAITAVVSADDQLVRATFLGMNLVVHFVIVPLAFGALVTGLICALGTKWGLFRHYWVLIKLVLVVIAIVVLLAQLEPIAQLAVLATDPTSSVNSLPEAPRPLVHAVGGLAVLLVVQVLGMYKPRGLTRYGWRKQREAESQASEELATPAGPGPSGSA
jgi:hypothetical protein